ncbi:MAG: hypothetical protein NTW87_30715 [Planctomycetota bacterium]|nr:hypothetical protein [Planctomycetota bacterium]
MKRSWSIALSLILVMARTHGGQDNAPEPRPQALPVYTFAELLAKAERIVVADVGQTKDGVATLVVRETLKAPENDAKYMEPERLKRAADLLSNDKLDLPPLPPRPQAPASVRAVIEGARLPPEGTQAIFFLWDKVGGASGQEQAYRVAHPQCLYDMEVVAQVRAAIARPRSVADGRYLREWDRDMAARARARQANEALLKAKGGDVVMGLRIVAAGPMLSLRGDNSFSVTARIENTRSREQAIYDGPMGGYGVLLRPKGAQPGAGIVLHKPVSTLGADTAVLGIADLIDFATVKGSGVLTKELFFDAKECPVLRGLEGEHTVSAFFSTTQDGRGLDLGAPVWTGTLVSEEVPLQFQKSGRAEAKP